MDPFPPGLPEGAPHEERAAASRQKSCNSCVRGKRRCDKRAPRCSRYAAKGLDCVYQRMPAPPLPPSPPSPASAADPPPPPPRQHALRSPGARVRHELRPGALADRRPQPRREPRREPQVGCEPAGRRMPGLFCRQPAGLVGAWRPGCLELAGLRREQDESPAAAARPSGSASDASLAAAAAAHPRSLPPRRREALPQHRSSSHVHDPRTRIGFIVSFLSSLASTFSITRALPFLHARLWANQLPKPMLSVFAAATAYSARTPQNRAWTTKLVVDASRDIHREGERATTPADKLARVQALIIVNSVHVFDGDVGLRAAAEREMAVFTTWTRDLLSVKVELEEGATMQRAPSREVPPSSWESWILIESMRRSIITVQAFMCIYSLLKSEEPNDELWSKQQTFTASRHLWDAGSSLEFYRAWREKPQYWIDNMSFKDFWMYGRPADLDEFTRVMLTPYVGLDAMDHFMEGDVTIPV